MKSHFGSLDEKALQQLRAAYDQNANSFSESCEELYDFKTCKRSNGTTYGSRGDCVQKGSKEVNNSGRKELTKKELEALDEGWENPPKRNKYGDQIRDKNGKVVYKKPKTKVKMPGSMNAESADALLKLISGRANSGNTPKRFDKYRGMKDPRKKLPGEKRPMIGVEFDPVFDKFPLAMSMAVASASPDELIRVVDRMHAAKASGKNAKRANQWIKTAEQQLDALYKKPGREALQQQRMRDLDRETARQIPRTYAAQSYRFNIEKYGVNSPQARQAGQKALDLGVTPQMMMNGLGRDNS